MPWLILAALGAGVWYHNRPKVGDLKRDGSHPMTDNEGRTYYVVYQYDGAGWIPYGRQYLG